MELTKFNPAQVKNKLRATVFELEVTEMREAPTITGYRFYLEGEGELLSPIRPVLPTRQLQESRLDNSH